MIVIFAPATLPTLRVEKIFAGKKLEHDAGNAPEVDAFVPGVHSKNGFGRAILAGLDIVGEVVGNRGCVAQISDLDPYWWPLRTRKEFLWRGLAQKRWASR